MASPLGHLEGLRRRLLELDEVSPGILCHVAMTRMRSTTSLLRARLPDDGVLQVRQAVCQLSPDEPLRYAPEKRSDQGSDDSAHAAFSARPGRRVCRWSSDHADVRAWLA